MVRNNKKQPLIFKKRPLRFNKVTVAVFTVFVGFYTVIKLPFKQPPDTPSVPIKKVDSPKNLIESRPQHLALIRCSPSEKNGSFNKANWPICGMVGAVPQHQQRITINTKSSFKDPLSVEFVDGDGASHKSQDWELMFLNLDQNASRITLADVQQTLSKWQKSNTWIRSIEQQKLSKDSPILRRFYLTVGQQLEDTGKSPWNSSKAYIDRRILKVQHGVTLFKTNDELIELAPLETGKSPYTPLHISVPKSLSEYSNINNIHSHWYPEPHCKGASRQALLVHEPHQRLGEETAFFFLLAYLQQQYPATFGKLHIFQEGQPNNLSFSDSIFNIPARGFDNNILKMLRDSRNAWESSFYAPLNGKLNVLKNDVHSFLVKKELPTEGVWDEAFDFYKFREKSGALDIRTAMKANLRDRTNERRKAQIYANRLKSLKVNDAAFAATLIEQSGFRGALAYELYAEGNASPTSGNSVFVHGLDDPGIYYASCALLLGCMRSSIDSKSMIAMMPLKARWKAIQPFRDWVMARTVVKKLESLDQSVVPVVAASVATHLPLVREFLCEAGIGTVTLDYNDPSYYPKKFKKVIKAGKLKNVPLTSIKSWQPPPSWQGTTPIMSFLTSTLSSPIPPSGGLRPSTGPGISQTLDTWITDPGLF